MLAAARPITDNDAGSGTAVTPDRLAVLALAPPLVKMGGPWNWMLLSIVP